MSRLVCEDLRDVAPELALGLVTGPERADALDHLAGCSACRALVDDLARVADGLLVLAPPDEPPAGFEGRVLARLTPPARRRAPWWTVAAAVVALLVGLAAGLVVAGGDEAAGPPAAAAAATFRTADGAEAGVARLYDGPPAYMGCVLEGSRADGGYTIEVLGRDGTVRPAGSFEAHQGRGSYAAVLGMGVSDVASVVVRDPDGVVRLEAEVAGTTQ